MLWLGRPQTHAKESRGWRRNGCRSRSSSGSPPWPGRSTPASRCGSSHSAPGCSLPAAAAPSPVGCACGAGATTSAITTCSAASDARPWRSPGSCSASSLSGSRAMGRARRWSSPSTTRPPSGTGRTSRALASITTPLRDRPGPRSSTATSGSVWPAWSDTRSGERSPCRSSRTCTSEPKMSAGWRPTTAGSSTPSWSWPPPRSSGWSSSWGPITRRSGW